MEIREVNIDDIQKLVEIGKQTFYETFASANSEEDMAAYLAKGFSHEKLKSELTDPNTLFYFAEEKGQAIGYLKINTGSAQSEMKDENTLEIERIYVRKEHQGKKVGQLLFEKAIAVANKKNVESVWLGVWEENLKAMRFYQKNGFKAFDKHIFVLGKDEQTDIMMKLEINPSEPYISLLEE